MHAHVPLIPLFAGIAFLTILLAIPLILGKVPRNYLYGVRTRRSMTGTEAEWYEINRRGGVRLVYVSCIVLAALAVFAIVR